MRNIKLWPHAALIGLAVAIAAGAGVWLYQRNTNNAEAAMLPNAARLQRVEGQVALADANETEWRAAGPNEPVSVGDRLYTRENAWASVAFDGRNYARLDPNTALDVVALSDDRTQLALRDGAAIFDVAYLPSGELFEVGTPYGAVDFNEPGLYYVDVNDGNTMVSVLSGLAQVVGLAGSGQIGKGEMLTLLGTTAAEVALQRLNRDDAGYLVDDYYGYQYPNNYDGRYANYDAYLDDPFYYDPYRNDVSYRYVTYDAPGINDLSYYGDWRDVDGYGYAWSPRVDAGWTPYQQGYWTRDYPYGLTWVSNEPWGYTPYHYGRWAFAGDRWYWIPEAASATPQYSPALVAFVPVSNNEIGWIPLGPGDAYVARYYDEDWQPHYLSRGDVIAANLVNLAAPNAITVVPIDYFGRPIDPRNVKHVNAASLANVRPTLEPLLLTPLRNAVIHSAWGRGKIDLPPGIAKKLNDTTVVVAHDPGRPRFKKDLDKSLRVERIAEKTRDQKLKVRDERNAGVPQADPGRQKQIDALAREAARGNKEARREVRQIERQQRQQVRQIEQQQRAQPKVERPSSPRAEGARIGNPVKGREAPRPQVQREAPRPQVKQNQPGRGAAKQQNKAPGQPKGGGGKGKGKP
ncbi:MAG TPA: FecR family protein [Pyrinomonadaceae bacterium]